jgi:putative FmdB family regulatory protein
MPTYDYACADCGAFEAIRPMAERDRVASCPRCGVAAVRVFAGGRHLNVVDGSTRRLIAAQERAAADGSYRRMRHAAGCGCC